MCHWSHWQIFSLFLTRIQRKTVKSDDLVDNDSSKLQVSILEKLSSLIMIGNQKDLNHPKKQRGKLVVPIMIC